MKSYILSLFSLIIFYSYTQEVSPILFKSGDHQPELNLEEAPSVAPNEVFSSTYYRILSFEKIPSSSTKEEMKAAGIELLNYLPEKSFFAAIKTTANIESLKKYTVYSIEKVAAEFKLTPKLLNKNFADWATNGNIITLQGVYYSTVNEGIILRELEKLGASIEAKNETTQWVQFTISVDQLDQLYKHPLFYYFEQKDAPPKPEGMQDVANHRSNTINSKTPGGLQYDGSGVNVMMQDDGPIGPHIDFKGRLDQRTTSDNGDHGDHCAGIIMGSGNKDPEGVGNAPGAFLYVYSAANSNYNYVPTLYFDDGVVITSKSYGNGQNTGYTSLARNLDFQSRYLESLLHVFSAGNSGTSDFGYGAGNGWGNITGGHKQGKNVIAVGNLNHLDGLANSSSRGPAADGRIKPDICAVGTNVKSTVDNQGYDNKTGTSMACPAIAGNLAQLYQAYRELNGGEDPLNALMKGLILNTADDLGNPGPDFKHGWGRINTRRAFDVLLSEQYIIDEIAGGDQKQYDISVPEGTAELRVMVYWTDYEGTVSSSKALVNDLDITLEDPNGSSYQPWVLNENPNPGTLNLPATRGNDNLNNVEQVTLENPSSGNHILSVSGTFIPQGPQQFSVIYEFIQDEVTLTHPIGGESFSPGIPETIRWDAYSNSGSFELEYTLDDGQTWTMIDDNVPGASRNYTWLPANEITGLAKIRISRNGTIYESPETFSILRSPSVINVEWACPNSFNISWNSVNGATGYTAYLLEDQYMDSVGTTSETNITIYANSNETQWVSVRTMGPNQARSERAVAVEKPPGTFNCTLSPPVANFDVACNNIGTGNCIRFTDMSENAGQGSVWEWTFTGGTPETSTIENPVVCYSQPGLYPAKLIVRNGVGSDSITVDQIIEVKEGANLPYQEDFEDGMPEEWISQGIDGIVEVSNQASSKGEGSASLAFKNTSLDLGSSSSILTSGVNISDSTVYELSFDVGYAQGNGNDTLVVYTTNDCGETLQEIFRAGGEELSSTDGTITDFLPAENDWTRKFALINNSENSNSLRFKFETISGQGNTIFIDNINILKSQNEFPERTQVLYPNPFYDVIYITGVDYDQEVTLRMYSYSGQMVFEKDFQAPGGILSLNVKKLPQGPYFIHLMTDETNSIHKLVKVAE